MIMEVLGHKYIIHHLQIQNGHPYLYPLLDNIKQHVHILVVVVPFIPPMIMEVIGQ